MVTFQVEDPRDYLSSLRHNASSDNWTCIEDFSLSDVFTGISMALLQSKDGIQYFTFEHSRDYQQVQFKFLDAVESMDPNNIVVSQGTPEMTL